MGADGAIGRRDRAHRLPLVAHGADPGQPPDFSAHRPPRRLRERARHQAAAGGRIHARVGGDRPIQLRLAAARRGRLRQLHREPDRALRPGRQLLGRAARPAAAARCANGRSGTSRTFRTTGTRALAATTRGRRNTPTLLKAASRKIRELDPDATIVLAGLADFAWQHLDRLARFGISAPLRRRIDQLLHLARAPGAEGRALLPHRAAPRAHGRAGPSGSRRSPGPPARAACQRPSRSGNGSGGRPTRGWPAACAPSTRWPRARAGGCGCGACTGTRGPPATRAGTSSTTPG